MTALALTLLAALAAATDPSPPGEWDRLARGEVVVSTGPGGRGARPVEAAILLDAPAERIWAVMVDCRRAPEFVPGLRECRVLEPGEDQEVLEHRVRISRLLPEVTYRFRARYRKHRRIDFSRIAGDLRSMEGSWSLEPVDDGRRTLVRYSVGLVPDFPVPQWLVRKALRHDLPELLLALRRRVAEP